ncbi:MAG TPA: hypothetical protein EYP41_02120, partial [Anaerolineae bacterium]|nr:hypothetical protein [Anaerolineae bacterium]
MYNDETTRPYIPQPPPPPPRRKWGCGCLGRLFIGGILLLALFIFGGVLIASTLIYSNLSGDIEEGIAKLDTARDRDTFETTRIFDRNGELLWEVFGE